MSTEHKITGTESKNFASGSLEVIVSGVISISQHLFPGPMHPGSEKQYHVLIGC